MFWILCPRKLSPFIAAYQRKCKKRTEDQNFSNWILGVYITYSVGSIFGKEIEYPKNPIAIFKDEGDNKISDVEIFSAFALKFNKEFEEGNK